MESAQKDHSQPMCDDPDSGHYCWGIRRRREEPVPRLFPLDYSLTDTFEGTDFFSNFQYWSAADPAEGYVQYVLFGLPVDICLVPNIV